MDRLTRVLAAVRRSAPALRNAAIRRITLAYVGFKTVEVAAWTAILIYAYGATGPESVGLIAVIQLVPSAVAAPILASFGARFQPRQLVVGWYIAQAAAVAATGAAIMGGSPAPIVYALSVVATIVLTQTRPIQATLLPLVADTPAELAAANALLSVGEGIGGFAGPLVVAALVATASIGTTFLAGAIVLALGAGLLATARLGSRAELRTRSGSEARRHGPPTGPETATDEAVREAARKAGRRGVHPAAVLAGLRAATLDRDTFTLLALLCGRLVIYGGLQVLIVLLAIDLPGVGQSGAGVLLAALGFGTIAGGVAAFGLLGRPRLSPWLGVGAAAIGLPIALVGLAPGSASIALLLVLCGIGLALLDVAGQTLLQRITPDGIRARVFGVLEGLLLIGEAVGSLVVGPFAVLVGVPTAAAILGLGLPVVAVVVLGRFAAIDRRAFVPEAEIRALRNVAMFAPLGPAAIESAARHLIPIAVAAGEAVVRQGEPGDRWYLVRAGTLSVIVDGRPIAQLRPGEGFGEIALLHAVPRTATVTARTDVLLWALAREEFLAAVTGTPGAYAEAEQLAHARMAAQVSEP